MIAPPGYPKTMSTPSRTSASQISCAPVRFEGAPVGLREMCRFSSLVCACCNVRGSIKFKKKKAPATFGCGGSFNEDAFPLERWPAPGRKEANEYEGEHQTIARGGQPSRRAQGPV